MIQRDAIPQPPPTRGRTRWDRSISDFKASTCRKRDNPKSEGKIGTQTVNEPCCQSTAPIRNQGDPSESGEVQAYRGHGLFCSYAQRKSGHEFDLHGRDNPRFRKMYGKCTVRTYGMGIFRKGQIGSASRSNYPCARQPQER